MGAKTVLIVAPFCSSDGELNTVSTTACEEEQLSLTAKPANGQGPRVKVQVKNAVDYEFPVRSKLRCPLFVASEMSGFGF